MMLNMVASVDGRASTEGKSAGIGSKVDRETMRNLRSRVDAVMIGAGTLRAERLSLGLDTVDSGLSGTSRPQPLAIVLTSGSNAPLRDNLIPHSGQQVVAITTKANAAALAKNLKGVAEVMGVPEAPEGQPDTTYALKQLRRERDIKSILVEGGPRLNHALISRGLIHELFLTLAPKLLGGAQENARTIIEGHLPANEALKLISVHLAADELFLHYSLASPSD